MALIRIALANVRFPATPEESVSIAEQAVEDAAAAGAAIVCFPECCVPGYRSHQKPGRAPSAEFIERAWSAIAARAAKRRIGVVLGTERLDGDALLATVLVIQPDGSRAGFQDKVQIDPSEEGIYTPGRARSIFQCGPLTFGISICHEGFRYPETVRWAAQRGAQVVFHPQFHAAEPGSFRPTAYGDPRNTFHEVTLLCRAAENTCYFATVNHASEGSPTTSAVAKPDGTLLTYQPYGEEGVLLADLELSAASRVLASRYKPIA